MRITKLRLMALSLIAITFYFFGAPFPAKAKLLNIDQIDGNGAAGGIIFQVDGIHDVGIIPDSIGNCPAGSEYVTIGTDDEDDNNISSVSGWTGVIHISPAPVGTYFGFCRVNGRNFHPYIADYAVLKLGTTCPDGSVDAVRYIDNENDSNANSSSGNIFPNSINTFTPGYPDMDTELHFCVFASPLNWPFPVFYDQTGNNVVPYGVFGNPISGFWLAMGHLHTDDEDDDNQSPDHYSHSYGSPLLDSMVYNDPTGNNNTEFEIVKVQ